ncbi:MAG: HAD family phosphatase [Sporichthyaceae bacterium]
MTAPRSGADQRPPRVAVPTTVVFDLGGVLVDWDPRYLYRQLLPEDEVEAFLTEVDFMAWNHRADSGGRWADAVSEHTERFPHRAELLAAYPARFRETLGGEVPGTVELLRELHRGGVRLLALTNWSAETFPHARELFDFLTLFEDVVVSGEEQLAKPDPAVFALLVDRYGLDARRTVFVDDSPRNVGAAVDAGLVALQFRDAHRLRADLAGLGLLTGSGGSAP